jgi:hypothetical protein
VWASIKGAYRESARAAVALPLLFALPVATELVQHAIEYRIGMFASLQAMEAVGNHPARMGFGQVKILSLILVLFWACRWHAFRGQRGRSVLGDRGSAFLFAGVVVLSMAIGAAQQFGGTLLAPILPDESTLMTVGIAFFLGSVVLDVYLTCWKVGSALGNPRLSIPASFKIMHGNFWWSLGFSLAMILPLMVAHYALNAVAIGQEQGPLWAILATDACLVGYLGLVLATTSFLIARRATERAGVPLAEARAPQPG